MDNDWNECTMNSYACMMGKANLAHRCSNAMMTINALSTVFYFIGSHISRRTTAASDDGESREFPMQIQFPFDATGSPVFEFVVLGLFLHVLETATVIAIMNSLILTLVSGARPETASPDTVGNVAGIEGKGEPLLKCASTFSGLQTFLVSRCFT